MVLALALGAIVIAAGWLFWGRGSARHGSPVVDDSVATETPPAIASDTKRPAAPAPPAREHVADQAGGTPMPPELPHAHPITPQHQRIFAENRIAFALDDATDAKDVAMMKDLLAQYRRDFPEDQWQLQSGYAVIIECLEHPGPASRQAAERWLDQNNGSTVKRSVLRNCIDPPQP